MGGKTAKKHIKGTTQQALNTCQRTNPPQHMAAEM
jgi:hypothetical protein